MPTHDPSPREDREPWNAKHERLKAEGWKAGNVQDFLGLTDEEMQTLETRLEGETS